jgi:hypothetical protein
MIGRLGHAGGLDRLADAFPWPNSTSTCRNLATISSGVYFLFGIGSSSFGTHA